MKINYRRLSMNEAKLKIAEIDALDDVSFEDLQKHWKQYEVSEDNYDDSYKEFRSELIECFDSTLKETYGD